MTEISICGKLIALQMIYHAHCTDVSTNGGKALRALYCLSFGPKKEYVETDFKPVEYRLGTTLIAFCPQISLLYGRNYWCEQRP